jgi:hypothetical protein
MKNYLKNKLRLWLGVESLNSKVNRLDNLYADLVSIGVDVHFKEPHMILIYSRLNGGQIREVRANFNNLKELNEFVRELKQRYATNHEIWDFPQGFNKNLINFF